MIKKIVMMCAAALFACAGAVADEGSDPGVLSPGEWTTDLTVNGKKVWSKWSAPKGAGWNCTYDSKAKSFTLTLLSPTEYTIGGKLTGRAMDKNAKVTKIETGKVNISQSSTVTFDNLTVTGRVDDAAVAIKDGKLVTIILKGKNDILRGEGECAMSLSIPPKATLTITGGETDSLNATGRCQDKIVGYEIKVDPGMSYDYYGGGRLVVEGGQSYIRTISLESVTVNGGSLSGRNILHGNILHSTRSFVKDVVVTGGFFDFPIVYSESAEFRGRARISSLDVTNLVLEDGADLEMTATVGSVGCRNFYMRGGKVSDSDSSECGITCSKMEMSSGSIACSWISGSVTLIGGEMHVHSLGGSSFLMNGGLVTTDSAKWSRFEQMGGRFVVNEGGSYKANDFYLYGGTFLGGTQDQKAACGCSKIFVGGGSLFVGTTEPEFESVSSGGFCCLVTIDKLTPNERVSMNGLGFYGKKDLYADASGKIYLYLCRQFAAYQFSLNGKDYTATVRPDEDVKVKREGVTYYKVVYQSYSGFVASNREWVPQIEVECEYGETHTVESPENLSPVVDDGKRFSAWTVSCAGRTEWKPLKPGDKLGPISGDVYLTALFEENIVADEDNGFDVVFTYQKEGVTGPVIKAVRQRLGEKFVFPTDYSRRIGRKSLVGWFASAVANVRQITADTIADGSVKRVYARYLDRTDRTTRPDNDAFANAQIIGDAQGLIEDLPLDRATKESGEFFYNTSAITGTLWYRWTAPMTGEVTFSAVNNGEGGRPILCGFVGQMSAPFIGLDLLSSLTFKCTAGMEIWICVASDGASSDIDLNWNVIPEEEASLQTWTMNRYGCADIMDLGIEVPSATMKAVKAEGLPKGLKLVQDKAKTAWYIEGVATEPLDYEKKFATIRFQFKTKGVDDNVQKIALKVVADKHVEHQTPLGEFSMSASGMFDAPVDKSWTVSGTPSGVNYDKKSSNPGFTGKLSKLGAFTLTAKEPVTSAVPGTSTKFNNVYTAELLVTPAGGYDDTFTVVKGAEMTAVDITAKFDWTANTKSKSTGQPTGMKYAAGVFSGKVTGKAGLYPVTVTSADKQAQANYLVRVQDPSAPSVGAYFGTKVMALLKKIGAGDETATKNGQYTYMRGAAVSISLMTTDGATVKAAGLPTGLKVEQDKTKKTWSITGVPTKVGDYLVTLTVTKNGVSSAVTYLFEIVENAFAGDYRGVIASSPAADAAPRTGTILVNIAAGGATKVTVSEDGKSTLTYSAKSYGYSDSGDYAFVEFELKPSSADKKLGYGKRKGRVTISKPDAEVGDYRILEGVVKLEDGTAVGEVEGWFVAPSAADYFKVGITRECRFFSCNDGDFDAPIATVRLEIKAGVKGKAATANVTGTLYDGTAVKLTKVPLVRDVAKAATGEEPNACYSFAPFAAKAKDGQVFVFHGFKRPVSWDELGAEGRVTFVNAAGEVVTVEEESGEGRTFAAMGFNSFFSHRYASSQMIFDYGWDGFESFALDHVSGAAKGDCVVLDVSGVEVTKIAAKNKVGLLGDFSYKFTTKDKIYTYQIDLVTAPLARYLADGTIDWMKSGRLVGFVTKTWKEGKTKKTLYGIVDIFGLEPAE